MIRTPTRVEGLIAGFVAVIAGISAWRIGWKAFGAFGIALGTLTMTLALTRKERENS